jgi:tRNA G46 methylase TrmB
MWESDSEDLPAIDMPVTDQQLQYFRTLHGRLYQSSPFPANVNRWNAEGDYILPTEYSRIPPFNANGSKREALRLENQHRLCYTILDGNLHLPWITIPPAAKILDLGTSSGIWAIEMANQYPTSTVIGVDISPQQTGRPPIPHNCSFQVSPPDSLEQC